MQGQEWHAWERDYDPYNPAYADGAYTHEDGSQYYQQVSHWRTCFSSNVDDHPRGFT